MKCYEEMSNIQLERENRLKEIENIDSKISVNEKLYTMGITLILAITYDEFFNGRQSGVSIPIFYIMFMGFFLWSVRGKVRLKKNIALYLIIATLTLSLNYSIHSNNILDSFNGIMIILITAVSNALIRYENIKLNSKNLMIRILNRVVKAIPENAWKPFVFLKSGINVRKRESDSTKKNILRGLIISIPLLIVILVLLTSADMVFKKYVSNISIGIKDVNIVNIASHLAVIVIIFLIIFSYIWSFKYNYDQVKGNKKTMQWEPVTVLTIISMINIVYLLFSIVQFSYLYGGGNNFLPREFTYSEYARKGFFELFAVTIINFTILISSMKYIKKGNKIIDRISKVLLTLLIAFTINMLFSAHYKMSLYEQIYGFTYLRIFVHIFMIMLFMLFLVELIGIWNRRMPINKVLIVIVLIMYILLNYINVDKIIAKENIDIYYKTQKIDVLYLESLSYDAIPEILKLKNDSNTEISSEVNRYLDDVKKELSEENSWYEFNYSKYRARKVIN